MGRLVEFVADEMVGDGRVADRDVVGDIEDQRQAR
jgi:hypothetical protein